MRVGVKVFAGFFPPHKGGYERAVAELSAQLAAHGCDVTVVTCDLGGLPSTEEMHGVKVYRLPSWVLLGGTYTVPKPTPRTLRLLAEALRGPFHLVHTHTRFFPTSWLGWWVAVRHRRPLLHTEHGAGHSRTGRRLVDLLATVADHLLGRALMRRSRVVAISRAVATFCRHLGAEEVVVIPDGVDARAFRPRRSSYRLRLGASPQEVVVACVGRLVWGKGVQDVLRAWRLFGKEGVRLVVAGDGPLRAELEALAREVGARALFLGELPPEEVAELLASADLFVSPTHSEGLGLGLLEAAAAGLPAVAYRVGGVPEVVIHGRTGLLVPVGDVEALGRALRHLVERPEERARLGSAARERARAFSWDRTAKAYLREIERLVGGEGWRCA